MKKLIFIIFLALPLFSENGNIYNCVDCSYSNPSYGNDNQNIQFASRGETRIVHQQPEDIQVLIQNYSCPNCGLFEISIRKNARKAQDIRNR